MRVSQHVRRTYKPYVTLVDRSPDLTSYWWSHCPMCKWSVRTKTWRQGYNAALCHADGKMHQTRRDIRLRVRANVQAIMTGMPFDHRQAVQAHLDRD